MQFKGFIGSILLLVVITACSSNKMGSADSTSATIDLAGTWELREAQNGMMPVAQHAPGNGNFFRFTATTFEHYDEGSLSRRGSYRVVPDTTASETVGLELPRGQFTHRIIFERDTTEKTFIDVRGDSMEMVSGFFPVDAGTMRVYVKTTSAP